MKQQLGEASNSGVSPYFHILLYDARILKGLFCHDASQRIGVHKNTYYLWERNIRVPRPRYLRPISEVLGIPLSALETAYAVATTHYLSSAWKWKVYPRLCSMPGCAEEHKGHGLCQTHLVRLKRNGSAGSPAIRRSDSGQGCSVPGCPEEHGCKGLCDFHYERLRRTGEVGGAAKIRNRLRPRCTFPGCTRSNEARSLCRKHYAQWRRAKRKQQNQGR